MGVRRDFFESLHDAWELFRVIVDQRKQRGLNPTLAMLRECATEVDQESATDPVTRKRIHNMLQFVERTSDWYESMQQVSSATLTRLMKLGVGITKYVK